MPDASTLFVSLSNIRATKQIYVNRNQPCMFYSKYYKVN